MKKILMIFIALTLIESCSKKEKPLFLLSDMNHQYSSIWSNAQQREIIAQMAVSLKNIMDIPYIDGKTLFDETAYYKMSLELLKKEATLLGLKINTIDPDNILIGSSHSLLEKKRMYTFFINLEEQNPLPLKNGVLLPYKGYQQEVVYGFQSLYPKGFLVSLLYAQKNLEQKEESSGVGMQIAITKDKNSFSKLNKYLKEESYKEKFTLLPYFSYPATKQMSGEVKWKIKFPQNTEWLEDVKTTLEEGKKIIFIKNKAQAEEKRFKITPSLESFFKEVTQEQTQELWEYLYTSLLTYVKKEDIGSEQELIQTLLYLKTHFSEWSLPKNKEGIAPKIYDIHLDSLSTSRGKITLFLSAKLSNEEKSTFYDTFKLFLNTSILSYSSSDNTKKTLDIDIYEYNESYSPQLNPESMDRISSLEDAYKTVYHIPLASNEVEYVKIPFLKSVQNPIFIGFSFYSLSSYTEVPFVPNSKIFLDSQWILEFLNKDKTKGGSL